MSRILLTGNGAAAWGVRLAAVDYIPAFPITPQTEIIETLSQWIDSGAFNCRMVTMDSEHSMITAAGAAAVTGVRVFTATSSQGLLYGMEMLYNTAGWRAPFVLINVSRALSAPITLEPDHNDIFAARDTGFLQLHCATCQEALDSVLLAYRLAEDQRVRLPILVNLDGYYLSFTREPVMIPPADQVNDFLPAFEPGSLRFSADHPTSQGVAVLGGSQYSYFRYQSHLASLNALTVFDEITQEFSNRFGRNYSALETYHCEEAQIVFFMIGSFSTKVKSAIDHLREQGKAIGLIRPRLFRPFPVKAILKALEGKKAVAVIDQNISIGKGGILHTELAAALATQAMTNKKPLLVSFIGGLGGRNISREEFFQMATVTAEALNKKEPPPPRLLFTREELEQIRQMQNIAGVKTEDKRPKK